nr:DUF2894 domain-containing protein [uncultured Cupriavidus sp.]
MHSHAPLDPSDPSDPRAMLDGWRDSGSDRADPVRFRFIEALARRACDYSGEARRLLEERIGRLVADYGAALARNPDAMPSPKTSSETMPCATDALADLAALSARLGRRAPPPAVSTSHAPTVPTVPTAPTAPTAVTAPAARPAHHAEPELADYFRDTWARVSVDRQLRQSQEGVPEKAGPLNTNHLVHRSLSLMREVSPGYLEQFLSYVDALSWLEGMHAISLVPEREASRASAPRAPAPRKPRAKASNTGSGKG